MEERALMSNLVSLIENIVYVSFHNNYNYKCTMYLAETKVFNLLDVGNNKNNLSLLNSKPYSILIGWLI